MFYAVASTLFHVLVPISVPVASGALLRRFTQLDVKPLLTLYLYFLSPAMIFDTLSTADITLADVYQTLGFSILNLLLLWGASLALGRLLRLNTSERAGLTLVSTFTNSVNYGLPLVLLAFGQAGVHSRVHAREPSTPPSWQRGTGPLRKPCPSASSGQRWPHFSLCPYY